MTAKERVDPSREIVDMVLKKCFLINPCIYGSIDICMYVQLPNNSYLFFKLYSLFVW